MCYAAYILFRLIVVHGTVGVGDTFCCGVNDDAELSEEIDSLHRKIDELEHSLLPSEISTDITEEQIAAKMKKDAENINYNDIPRLIKTYINKVYVHNDRIVITGGVHFNGCGGQQYIMCTVLRSSATSSVK